MKRMIDYSLYLVTDRELAQGRENRDIVEAAVRGGVSCVQLRDKQCSTRDFIDQARQLKNLLRRYGVPLIINDRVDVALAIGAEGVHLGQTDMDISDARRIVGRRCIIGISAESLDDALRAEQQGADYIGISPVFATTTKADTAPPLHLHGVTAIRRHTTLPLVGIGGLHCGNVEDVILAGADGIAVVSAIVASLSPEQAARDLRRLIGSARGKKNGNG